MGRINRDTAAALFLLVLCGVLFSASFFIRDMGYETLGSEVWPRIVLVVATALSLLYLVRSVVSPPVAGDPGPAGLKGWYATYRNALWCFVAFGLFLATLPYLGMLIGGVAFVFAVLTLLGGWDARALVAHGAIALLSVGAMWAIFTFGLRVILPEGEIFSILY